MPPRQNRFLFPIVRMGVSKRFRSETLSVKCRSCPLPKIGGPRDCASPPILMSEVYQEDLSNYKYYLNR